MKKLIAFFAFCAAVAAVTSCKKTPDYVADPYKCKCGNLTWQDASYDLLGTSYILSDSLQLDSRRYYFTANVAIEGETQTHGLSVWIQIDSLLGGGLFRINPQLELNELIAHVDEFNLNDPIDTLRRYVPVNAAVSVAQAPASGGIETVNFQLTLNQVINGIPVSGNVNCSGSFNVYVNQ